MTTAVLKIERLTRLAGPLADIFTWWRQELVGLTPSRLRTLLFPARSALAIEMGKNRIVARTIDEEGRQQSRPIRIARNSTEPSGSRLPKLERLDLLPDAIEIRIDPSLLYTCELALPPGPREKVVAAIGLQLERLIPLQRDEIAFSFAVKKGVPKEKVQVFFLKRGLLTPAFAALSRAGIRTKRLSVFAETASGRMTFDIPPPSDILKRRSLKTFLISSLGISLVAWSLLLIGYGVILQVHENSLLERAAEMQDQLAGVSGKITAFEAHRAKAAQLSRLLTTPSLASVLEDLSHLVPKDSWVDSFTLQGNRVVLEGHSPDPSSLVQPLESSPAFSEVRLVSTGATSQGGEGQAFRITLTLAAGKGPGP